MNKSRNKGRSKGRSLAQDRRRLRKLEKKQVEVTGDKMLGHVARRGYGGGVVTQDEHSKWKARSFAERYGLSEVDGELAPR